MRRGDDLSPAMETIAGVLVDNIEEAFQKEQAPGRQAWHPLSDTTIRRRDKAGYWPGQKLQQTGRLASSITSAFGKDYAIAGTNVIYAAHINSVLKRAALVATSTVASFLGEIFPQIFCRRTPE